MRAITDEQIMEIVNPEDGGYDYSGTKFTITRDNGYVTIKAERMYEYCPLPFKTLLGLSQLFNTTEIEEPDREHWSGCESCDYGSNYRWTLRIKEPTE